MLHVREAAEDDSGEGLSPFEIQVDPTSYAPGRGGITPPSRLRTGETRIGQNRSRSRRHRGGLEGGTSMRGLRPGLAARYAGDGPGEVVGFVE